MLKRIDVNAASTPDFSVAKGKHRFDNGRPGEILCKDFNLSLLIFDAQAWRKSRGGPVSNRRID
jgi:hypothetical protein